MQNVESNIFFEVQKYYFAFESRLLFFFSNDHISIVVSTLPNVVKIDVENDNVVSTLSNVVQFNVENHNIVSTLLISTLTYATLFQRWFDVGQCRDFISTQKQRWTDVEMFAESFLERRRVKLVRYGTECISSLATKMWEISPNNVKDADTL